MGSRSLELLGKMTQSLILLIVGLLCAGGGGELFIRGIVSLATWARIPAGISSAQAGTPMPLVISGRTIVAGAVGIAIHFGLDAFVIGATIVALGTSVPELATTILACGLGAWSLGKRSALIVGVGMIPRGEVGIIVASLGQAAGVFSGQLYAVIIAMSLLTSLIAPPAPKPLLVKENHVTD